MRFSNASVLAMARHLLLALALCSLLGAVGAGLSLDHKALKPATLGAEASSLVALRAQPDGHDFREVCLSIAAAWEEKRASDIAETQAFTAIVRQGFKLALGFCVIACVALLAAWVAAGAVLRRAKQAQN